MLTTTTQTNDQLLTIGELAKRTGITTHTLRMWEKRYQAPKSIRLPSGHRRYLPEEADRLQAVAKALELGFRAGKIVGGTLEELQELMGLEKANLSGVPSQTNRTDQSQTVDSWLQWVKDFDEELLVRDMHCQWGRLGPLRFVADLAAPWVMQIGEQWQQGHLKVAHEHFATSLLSDFLSNRWRGLNEHKEGRRTALLTTLPGEKHILGLLMCAVVTAVTNWKVIFLGLDTPEEEIVHTMRNCNAKILCVSVTGWFGVSNARPILWRIRKQLSKDIDIFVGGSGAPEDIKSVHKVEDFNKFHTCLIKHTMRR